MEGGICGYSKRITLLLTKQKVDFLVRNRHGMQTLVNRLFTSLGLRSVTLTALGFGATAIDFTIERFFGREGDAKKCQDLRIAGSWDYTTPSRLKLNLLRTSPYLDRGTWITADTEGPIHLLWCLARRELPIVLEQDMIECNLSLVSSEKAAGAATTAQSKSILVGTSVRQLSSILLARVLAHPVETVAIELVRLVVYAGVPHAVRRDSHHLTLGENSTVR